MVYLLSGLWNGFSWGESLQVRHSLLVEGTSENHRNFDAGGIILLCNQLLNEFEEALHHKNATMKTKIRTIITDISSLIAQHRKRILREIVYNMILHHIRCRPPASSPYSDMKSKSVPCSDSSFKIRYRTIMKALELVIAVWICNASCSYKAKSSFFLLRCIPFISLTVTAYWHF